MSHSDIDMHALIEDIKAWGLDRGILPHPSRRAQFKKTAEEVGELLEAIDDNDPDAAEDSIGDIIVTLIMQAEAWGTDIRPALRRAYKVISGRTGKMVDGVFVKDEEAAL